MKDFDLGECGRPAIATSDAVHAASPMRSPHRPRPARAGAGAVRPAISSHVRGLHAGPPRIRRVPARRGRTESLNAFARLEEIARPASSPPPRRGSQRNRPPPVLATLAGASRPAAPRHRDFSGSSAALERASLPLRLEAPPRPALGTPPPKANRRRPSEARTRSPRWPILFLRGLAHRLARLYPCDDDPSTTRTAARLPLLYEPHCHRRVSLVSGSDHPTPCAMPTRISRSAIRAHARPVADLKTPQNPGASGADREDVFLGQWSPAWRTRHTPLLLKTAC